MSFCTSCGKEIPQDATYCPYCGGGKERDIARTNKMAIEQKKRKSGMAIPALVCGICGIIIPYLGVILGLLGIVFGGIGISQTRKDPTLGGKGMAIAGLICGIIGFIFWGLVFLGAVILSWGGVFSTK